MAATKSAAQAPSMGATASAPIVPENTAAAPTFDAFTAGVIGNVGLTEDGQHYIENLTKAFVKKAGTEVTVEDLNYRVASVACVNRATKQFVVILFNENYINTQKYPATEIMPDLVHLVRAKLGSDFTMAQYIVVIPSDYGRADQMASHVINIFRMLNSSIPMTAALFNDMKLTPSTDVESARRFVNLNSPHEVQDRMDWGVLINRAVPATHTSTYQTGKVPETQTLAAIGGYTKFMSVNTPSGIKYLPICVITNVTSIAPSCDILNLVLPITAGCIIAQRVWERPYTTFAKDRPNLGVLQMTPDNKGLNWFTNIDQMRRECQAIILDTPMLAIDIPEGRAHLPGLESLLFDSDVAVREQFTRFFGNTALTAQQMASLNQPTVISSFFNYEGVYKTNGALVDTRNADYINMVTETKDFRRCQPALYQNMSNPGQHLADVSAIYGEDAVTPLYRCTTLVFNNNAINLLAACISTIIRYTGESCVTQNVDVGALLQQYTARIGGGNAIYGGVSAFGTPGNIYGAW